MPRYECITFDCYGTLIDWDEGIGASFERIAHADGFRVDRAQLLQAYAEIEPVVQAAAFRSYRDVLSETTRRVARRLDWPMTDDKAAFLAASLPDWPPFPDTHDALRRLAGAGYRLGILSNIDDDLIAMTLRRFDDVRFDPVVTAQEVGAYKPAQAHFLRARERIGDCGWLHAAQSLFHDVRPAAELGIPVAWVNRYKRARPADAHPARELASLADLADWLV